MNPFRRLGARSRPSITLGAADRAFELTEYRLTSEDGSTSIASPYEGAEGRPEYIEGSAYQSLTNGSLWRFTRDYSGETVAFEIRPHGDDITGNSPAYRGLVTVGPKPDLGGSASDETFIFDFSWRIVGEVEEYLPHAEVEA